MRLVLRRSLLTIALLAVSVTAYAQAPTELPPGAYALQGSLDVVMPADGSDTFTTAQPVIMAGWVFECRSGLQPQTQRLGDFIAYWSRRIGDSRFGEVQYSNLSPVTVAVRPDVALAYRSACPAVGQSVGFLVVATPPDEQADWTLNLSVTTVDGAGNRIWWQAQKVVRVWYVPPPIAPKR